MNETEQLWEWREKIANLYYQVRFNEDVTDAWRIWCETRSRCFATTLSPQSKHKTVRPITGRQRFLMMHRFPWRWSSFQ